MMSSIKGASPASSGQLLLRIFARALAQQCFLAASQGSRMIGLRAPTNVVTTCSFLPISKRNV